MHIAAVASIEELLLPNLAKLHVRPVMLQPCGPRASSSPDPAFAGSHLP